MASYGAQMEVDINVYAKDKGAKIVDLRSDTVTKPSPAMRKAMHDAIVGDDVFGEDPTVIELERKAAQMVGKEAALFVTSGTMGNLISMMVHCNERGCEAYCGEDSHVVLHEQGGSAQIAGVTISTLPNNFDGSFDLDTLERKFRTDRLHEPTSTLVIVENPFNGAVVDPDWLEKLAILAAKRNLSLHMDGARLWNAVVAQNTSAHQIVEKFDSVTFCLSKGLGAPAGSLICGTRDFIAKARRIRKVLGGAMRQVGVLAAAGIVALDETIPLLKDDHERARKMAKAINNVNSDILFPIQDCEVTTNMLFLNIRQNSGWTSKIFVTRISEMSDDPKEPKFLVRALALGKLKVRLVFHRDIDDELLNAAVCKIIYVLKK